MRCLHKSIVAKPFFVVGILLAMSISARALEVEITKIPDSTAMIMRIVGQVDANPNDVVAVLCDFGGYPEFTDSFRSAAVLDKKQSDEILSNPFADVDEAEEYMPKGKRHGACPGASLVLAVQDLPWPVPDIWSLSTYVAGMHEDGFYINFESYAGSHRGSRGSFVVSMTATGKTLMTMNTQFDMGFSLPAFVMKVASKIMMPKMYRGIKEKALRFARRATGTSSVHWFDRETTMVSATTTTEVPAAAGFATPGSGQSVATTERE